MLIHEAAQGSKLHPQDWDGLPQKFTKSNGGNSKTKIELVGGLEHFLFSHILGIIIPIEVHIFQRGSNHQPVKVQRFPFWSYPNFHLSCWVGDPHGHRQTLSTAAPERVTPTTATRHTAGGEGGASTLQSQGLEGKIWVENGGTSCFLMFSWWVLQVLPNDNMNLTWIVSPVAGGFDLHCSQRLKKSNWSILLGSRASNQRCGHGLPWGEGIGRPHSVIYIYIHRYKHIA